MRAKSAAHVPALDRRQSRDVDRRAIDEYGMSGLVLMENAGRGLADKLLELGFGPPIVVCCGKGNNAGDGFVLARHLDIRRLDVQVLVWADPAELAGDAAVNYSILARSGVPIAVFGPVHDPHRLADALQGARLIVDGLLGTGAVGNPRPPLDAVIDQLNAHPAPKLAIDIPSGLDCDTGQPSAHTIRACHTCTFVAEKIGFRAARAADFTGTVHILDIGAPRRLIDQVLATSAPPPDTPA